MAVFCKLVCNVSNLSKIIADEMGIFEKRSISN